MGITLMKGDKVVEALEICSDLPLLSIIGNHYLLSKQLVFCYPLN